MAQITNDILMIRPVNFGFNEETAINNAFQSKEGAENRDIIIQKAQAEFDQMVKLLQQEGVHVLVIEDTEVPPKPDAIFPNNWLSLHEGGIVITYPMFAQNRRIERRSDIIDLLETSYHIDRRYEFEHYEDDNIFLEGTGSMILDRENKIVYACLSERTDITLLDKFCVLMGYKKVTFTSTDSNGDPIYHTNVMMALGQKVCVLCLDSVSNEEERQTLLKSLKSTHKQIIDLSLNQVSNFAGNMLEVRGRDLNKGIMVMSKNAYDSLKAEQIETLKLYCHILPINIPTIEFYGGGSVRCMMAEIFLKPKNAKA